MADERETRKIMTKPLPEILDELEDSIKLADEAAKNAREAAEEARRSVEQAASQATRAATEAVARIEQVANSAMQQVEFLNMVLMEAAATVEKRLSVKLPSPETPRKDND